MSILFVDGSGNYVYASSSLNVEFHRATIMTWVYLTDTLSAFGGGVVGKGTPSGTGFGRVGMTFFQSGASKMTPQITIRRATTDCVAQTEYDRMPVWGLNNWLFVAGVVNVSGSSTDQKLYSGNLSTRAAEASSYNIFRQVGSGNAQSTVGHPVIMGASPDGTFNFRGRIGPTAMFDRILTLNEIQSWQYNPRVLPNCKGLWFPGRNELNFQKDYSGIHSGGVIIGGSLSLTQDPPMRFCNGGPGPG